MGATSKLRPVVAYEVLDDYEGQAEVVFHRHAAAAGRIGADELNTDFSGVRCRRAHWADRYAAQGFVPAAALVANGWRYESCCGCGAQIDEDTQNKRGLTVDRIHGPSRGAVFCCVECAPAPSLATGG